MYRAKNLALSVLAVHAVVDLSAPLTLVFPAFGLPFFWSVFRDHPVVPAVLAFVLGVMRLAVLIILVRNTESGVRPARLLCFLTLALAPLYVPIGFCDFFLAGSVLYGLSQPKPQQAEE